MSFYKPSTTRVKWHDSPEAFLGYISALPKKYQTWEWLCNTPHKINWLGASAENALKMLQYGDRTYLKNAEALMDKMREEGLLSYGQKIWQSDVIGAYPNVANYIMGQPDTMFNKIETDLVSNTTPIRIFIDLFLSAGVTVQEAITKGNAILGFIMAMQNIRPIELYVVCITNNYQNFDIQTSGSVIKIDTQPMDIDRALYMCGNPAFARQLCFPQIMYQANPDNVMKDPLPPAWELPTESSRYHTNMRELLALEPHDVLMSGQYLYNTEYLSNPVKWIKKEMQKYTTINE